jgi:hypothetical protein
MQGDTAVHSLPDRNVGWKNHGCGFSAFVKMLSMDHLLHKTTIGGNASPSELTGKTREGDMGCFGPSQRSQSRVWHEVCSHVSETISASIFTVNEFGSGRH